MLRSFLNVDKKVLLDWCQDEISFNEESPTVNIATNYTGRFLLVASTLGFVAEDLN